MISILQTHKATVKIVWWQHKRRKSSLGIKQVQISAGAQIRAAHNNSSFGSTAVFLTFIGAQVSLGLVRFCCVSCFLCWLAFVLTCSHDWPAFIHLVYLDSPGSSPGGQVVPLPVTSLFSSDFSSVDFVVLTGLIHLRSWKCYIFLKAESLHCGFKKVLNPVTEPSGRNFRSRRDRSAQTGIFYSRRTSGTTQASHAGNNGNPPEPLRLSPSRFLRTSFVSSLLWRLLRSACSLFRNTSTWTLPWALYSQTSGTLWQAGNMWGCSPLHPTKF